MSEVYQETLYLGFEIEEVIEGQVSCEIQVLNLVQVNAVVKKPNIAFLLVFTMLLSNGHRELK